MKQKAKIPILEFIIDGSMAESKKEKKHQH
jgi:hypothetical protein